MNLGTLEGAKLYIKGTAKIDNGDKFDITISNARKFLDHMTHDTNTFGWDVLVCHIQVDQNEFKIFLVDHKDIIKEDIKRQVYRTWGSHLSTFQDQVPQEYDLQIINRGQKVDHVQTFY